MSSRESLSLGSLVLSASFIVAFHSLIQDPVLGRLVLTIGIAFLMSPIVIFLAQICVYLERLSKLEAGQTKKEGPSS